MTEIHILDYDGCIFPQVLTTNLSFKISISEFKQKMKNIEIFNEFKNYYDFIIANIKDVKFYVVTGRTESDFGKETIRQLEKIEKSGYEFSIKYFPGKFGYTKLEYLNFKSYEILNIIYEDNGKSTIRIYDDICDYYRQLIDVLKNMELNNIIFYKVNRPQQFWNLMIKQYMEILKNENRNTR